jgi:hypothetical protein
MPMHGPNRCAVSTLMLCSLASAGAVAALPTGWTIDGSRPQVTDINRTCNEAHGGRCSVRLSSDGAPLAVDVPEGASALAFGVLLTGRGRVWGDDLELTVVDEGQVASTDILPRERVWRRLDREPAALARRPVNLGFEE